MKSSEFCYWLQGFFELSDKQFDLTTSQVNIIKNHLNLVFRHELDKTHGDEKEQAELNQIHTPIKSMDRPSGMRC